MNNDDKHRALRPAAMKYAARDGTVPPTPVDCTIETSHSFGLEFFYVGAKWSEYHVVPTGPSPSVTVNDRIVPMVGFAERNVWHEFPRCYAAVRSVLRVFWALMA